MSFLGWGGMVLGLVGVEFGSHVGVDFGDYTANPQKSLDGGGASFERRLDALPWQTIVKGTLGGDLIIIPGHAFQLANDAAPESPTTSYLGIRVEYVHKTLLLFRRQILELAQVSE